MRKIPVYSHPAAGWPALISSTRKLMDYQTFLRGSVSVLKSNQPKGGFDCPGCAWPDHKSHKAIDVCENGIKVIASETMTKKPMRSFLRDIASLNYKAGRAMSLSIVVVYQSLYIMMPRKTATYQSLGKLLINVSLSS